VGTIEIDGAALAADVDGQGGDAIAFVHGWCSKSAHWDRQVEHFAPTHRTVRWDRRGMSRSAAAAAATSPARHADDLAGILDHLGIETATVVGHAGGGPATIAFAGRHPERIAGMVLVDTRLFDPRAPDADGVAASIAQSAERIDDDAFFARLYASFFGPRAPRDVVDDAVANALRTDRATAAEEMRHVLTDTAALARQVACPVLWVSAHPGDTGGVREAFPDAMVGHVVGSGHFVGLEVPEQLNAMIDVFLASHAGAGARPAP
jgi:pimeloyl-ACP methyl ester carboxylesterase